MKMPSRVQQQATTTEEPLIEPKAARSFMNKKAEEDESAIKQICLKISPTMLSRCDAAAKIASVTRSAYIKIAIAEKLERDGR